MCENKVEFTPEKKKTLKTDVAIARLHLNKYFRHHGMSFFMNPSLRKRAYVLIASYSSTMHRPSTCMTVSRRVTNQPLHVDVLLFSCCLGETRRIKMQVYGTPNVAKVLKIIKR